MAIRYYYNAWMCRFIDEPVDETLGSRWQYVATDDPLNPFEGYALTQPTAIWYNLDGMLNNPTTTEIDLRAGQSMYAGQNLVANSWVAPIRISSMSAEDFGDAEQTIYLYNAGKYSDWETAGSGAAGGASTSPGQYIAIPRATAEGMGDAYNNIAPMQGFFVITKSNTTLTLNYENTVRANSATTTHHAARAPRRVQSRADEWQKVIIDIKSEVGSDRVFIFASDEFTDDFDNGYDGKKMTGDSPLPRLAVETAGGQMAVAAVPQLEGKRLNFRAGKSEDYEISFGTTLKGYVLYDLLTGIKTPIDTMNTYYFYSSNQDQHPRFEIRRVQNITTDIETDDTLSGYQTAYFANGALCVENSVAGNTLVEVFDPTGKLIVSRNITAGQVFLPMSGVPGVYMVRFSGNENVKTLKVIL